VGGVVSVGGARTRPRPERAIDARKQASTAKIAAVSKVVKLLGRSGAPMTRAAISQLAGVSRSFTYENDDARAIIAAAQTRSQAHADSSIATITAQQEASWRERALNAEDRTRELSREIATQRRLVSDLTGQLREPDGTWIEHDRNRLRRENQTLLLERNQLASERAELQRRLDGARANVSRLNEQRVTQLFPNGPGPTKR
jgi:chromosome segregation ATPase